MSETKSEERETVDIFAWANKLDAVKNDLTAEIYFVNKKGTPFRVNLSGELVPQIAPVFVYGILNHLQKGAGTGLAVREFELNDEEDGVLLHSTTENVEKAAQLLGTIKTQSKDIEIFSEYDHEFKTINKVVAKFSHANLAEPFYVVKLVSGSSSLNQRTSWEINEDGKLQPFTPEMAFKVPTDEQVLITGGDIFIFKQSKFVKLFDYNYKQQLVAEQKVAEIMRLFDLSFPDGLDMQKLVKENRALVKKIQDVDPTEIKQAELIKYSEELELDLMTDNDGKIIIMDSGDLATFIGLLNDDYVMSDLTGKKYIVRGNKKSLEKNE
ncbi:MAG: DUF4868 domain-containing protein [Candidatus Nomurabacteria bacterium]|jgi:hypothetical protein|nr:DUF4868 domain-containing protein [Candidatus Nomurabacteria bacterium]